MWIYCSCMGRTKIVSLSYSKSTLVKQQQHFLFPAQKYTCQFFLNFTLQVTNFILITASAKTLVHKKKKEYTFLLFFLFYSSFNHTLYYSVCVWVWVWKTDSHTCLPSFVFDVCYSCLEVSDAVSELRLNYIFLQTRESPTTPLHLTQHTDTAVIVTQSDSQFLNKRKNYFCKGWKSLLDLTHWTGHFFFHFQWYFQL